MAFLCLAHQQQIALCSINARRLVVEATTYGAQRQQACRWREASIFFGRAYEALKIRLLCQTDRDSDRFTAGDLIEAHYALCCALHQLDEPPTLRRYRLELPYVLHLSALHDQLIKHRGEPDAQRDSVLEYRAGTEPRGTTSPSLYVGRQLAKLRGLETITCVFTDESDCVDTHRAAGF